MLSEHYRRDQVFHIWLVLQTVTVFGASMLWDRGLYQDLVRADASYLCVVMSLIFVGTMIHGGQLALRLARLAEELDNLMKHLPGDDSVLSSRALVDAAAEKGLVVSYFRAVAGRGVAGSTGEPANLAEVLAERVRGAHALGWHLTDLLVKLGLLGTVIGFMIMLNSVASLESFDIENAQQLMTTMMEGMGVALNTTLFGFVCGMIAGFQYLILDQAADRFLADVVYVAESRLETGFARSVSNGIQA